VTGPAGGPSRGGPSRGGPSRGGPSRGEPSRVEPANGERGTAVVEFCSIGLLLMLPLIYLVVAMGRIEAASFAADGSAREAARALVTARNEAAGRARAAAAVRLGLLDQGFDVPVDDALVISCSKTPCLSPGGEVITRVAVPVVLPGVPAIVDRVVPVRVTVRSEQVAMVDAFRAVGLGFANSEALQGMNPRVGALR